MEGELSKQYMSTIAAGSIELGPLPFDLYSPDKDGWLILFCRKGFSITEKHMELLSRRDRRFYIPSSSREAYIEYASERLERIISSPTIRSSDKAKIVYGVGRRVVEQLMNDPRSGETIKRSKRYVENQVAMIFSSPEAAANMFAISAYDSYTFSHSVNVCTFCVMLSETLIGNDEEELKRIGLAGLLHDIGKSLVDPGIVNKPSRLSESEWEEMKRHTVYSHDLLKDHRLPREIASAGRSHHERLERQRLPRWARRSRYRPHFTHRRCCGYLRRPDIRQGLQEWNFSCRLALDHGLRGEPH